MFDARKKRHSTIFSSYATQYINNNKNNNNDITSFTKFPSLKLDKICVTCIYITFPTEEVFFPHTSQLSYKRKTQLNCLQVSILKVCSA